MIPPRFSTKSDSEQEVGVEEILKDLVRDVLRGSSEVVSIAVGDRQGLPIINATKGTVPVMTYTAMATMSMKAARTAAEAVGMEQPEYLVVWSPDGILVILRCAESQATLLAQLKDDSNLDAALGRLRKLRDEIGAVLGDAR